ncbi:MAG TPA: CopG family ribbon-helix-helix protein [Nitrososphaeraceae archaeon]|nr:CopG family ribbon-helix-helix protein [Nitrososphaeraceae archaeon]
MQNNSTSYHKSKKKSYLKRISMSLPSELLSEFDKSTAKAGFPDRSKAIQTALHLFIDENEWETEDEHLGAGSITMLYNNHIFNQDTKSTQTQHMYNEIISAATHIHLDSDNCLETIMVKGKIKAMKNLVNDLTENRGIKSLKVIFVSIT